MRNTTLHLTYFARPKESGVGVEVASVELIIFQTADFVGQEIQISCKLSNAVQQLLLVSFTVLCNSRQRIHQPLGLVLLQPAG